MSDIFDSLTQNTQIKRSPKKKTNEDNNRVLNMIDTTKKDKIVSLKVNPQMWARFRKVCGLYGSTANGMVNQLVAEYVYAKEKELRD